MIYQIVYRWRRLKSRAHLLAEIDHLERKCRSLEARLLACETERIANRPVQGDQ